MLNAILRKAVADLRSHPLQTTLLFGIVAAAAAILMLAISIPQSVNSSFDRAHDEAHGAHVWFGINNTDIAEQVADLPGVVESTDVYEQVRGTLMSASEPDDVVFLGVGADIGGISPAVVVEGRWIETGSEGEMVISRGLARNSGLDVGDVANAATASSGAALRVVGIAVDTSSFPYPQYRPGIVFVSQPTVRDLVGGPVRDLTLREQGLRRADLAVGVRIDHPEAAKAFVAEAQVSLGEAVYYSRTWLDIRDAVAEINDGPGIIFRVFSFFGLLAAGIIVASAITGHVLAQTREVGVLKATGFGPGHVLLLFLGQQLVLGLVAAITGVILAVVVTPSILEVFAELLYSGVSPDFDPVRIVAVVLGIGILIVVFTLLPAWRAGRISTVAALSGRYQRSASKPSLLARYAIRLHMPHVVVFGLKDVFARKTRAWLTVAAAAVVASVVMMTLTLFGMFDRMVNDPTSLGAWPFELRVERLGEFGTSDAANGAFVAGVADPISHKELVALVESHSEVKSLMTIWETSAVVVEVDEVLQTYIIDGLVGEFGFRVTDGQMFTTPHEAVIGLGLAQTYGLGVGDQVTVLLRLNEARTEEIPLAVVGVFALSEANLGRVLMYGVETLHDLGIIGESTAPIGNLSLKLVHGVDAGKLAEAIFAETGGRVVVTNVAQRYQENLKDELALIPLMLTLNGVLIALAAGNMLIALVFSVRERTREFGILKTVGFTPRQIVATVVFGAAVLAVIGVVIGIPIGYVLTRLWMAAADTDGLPSDLVQLPSILSLTILVPLAAVLVAIGSTLPARRAAAITITDALRFE